VILTLTTQQNAVIMPSAALQTGQQGQYVFVVKPDFTVESRQVTVSRSFGDFAVVRQGVSAGEKVVVDGQLNLIPGARVEVKGENVGNPKPGEGNVKSQVTNSQ
jgi:membrane fusion protein, multidrug efflux system